MMSAPLFCQANRVGPTLASRRASDEGDLAVKLPHASCLLFLEAERQHPFQPLPGRGARWAQLLE